MSGSDKGRRRRLRVEVTPYERLDGRQECRVDLLDETDHTVASLGWWSALDLAADLTKAVGMLRESTVEAGRVVYDMRRNAAGGDR
ncbi:MAG TPA: hypothetical protein VKZ67_08950 [Natronosporangium sp.]|nr:hypothetical protein [Natronosporangium sp.]